MVPGRGDRRRRPRLPRRPDATPRRGHELALGPSVYRSDDGGESFNLDEGLWDHEHRAQWQPGGGGLCLHTVVIDPAGGPRLGVAVFYRTTDGRTWEAANTGIGAAFLPEPTPAFGQCVH